jgi:hypothetical protein
MTDKKDPPEQEKRRRARAIPVADALMAIFGLKRVPRLVDPLD